jgi:hypothetical protein
MPGRTSDEKAKRRANEATLLAYHQEQLADLLGHVRRGLTEFDSGRIDAFELDDIIHHYTLASRELWKFCAVSPSQAQTAVWMLERWRVLGEERQWWKETERPRR